jgi:hypothetical protein
MPGIDVNDVVDGLVDEELLCSICTDIIQQPRCCHAGHVFCEECIKTWLQNNSTCPIGREQLEPQQLAHVRPLERMVDRIRVRCPNRGPGRSWACGASGCGWVGLCADRAAHLDNECVYQPVPCTLPGCDETVPRRRLAAHMRTCPCRETALRGNASAAGDTCHAAPSTPARTATGAGVAGTSGESRRSLASWALIAAGGLLVAALLLGSPGGMLETAPAVAFDGEVDTGTEGDAAEEARRSQPDGNEPGGTDSNAPRSAGGGIEISFDTATATPQTIVSAMRGLGTNADVQESGCLALWSLAYRNGATSAEIVRGGGVEAVIAAMQTHVRLSPSNWRVQELCTAALWNMAIDGWWREGAPPTAGDLPGVQPPAGTASTSWAIVRAGGLEAVVEAMTAHATEHAVVR